MASLAKKLKTVACHLELTSMQMNTFLLYILLHIKYYYNKGFLTFFRLFGIIYNALQRITKRLVQLVKPSSE